MADTSPNAAFLQNVFGWDVRGHSENLGPEQDDLDDLDHALVTVTGLGPAAGSPGIELLDYHVGTRRSISGHAAGHDVATTYSVLKVNSVERLRADAEANGARFISAAVTKRDGCRSMLVVGPDGHRFLAEELPHGNPEITE
ncbi:VOC family protein [Amycolatopsis sp. FDAARGOS 1241]|uniref:VOC family protein n=1 Tax=Amycolatopsis sp. FDAARGOS 1241 TaxID=2778070 RepID=UPI00194EDD5F|nr:VOC family protein [Amycolatopsis sp. FDAARGOS 1241]QRP48582.1 hypothetical protein I6J71_12505 [Amycolatopsis sp. FDAARGOS 1241]